MVGTYGSYSGSWGASLVQMSSSYCRELVKSEAAAGNLVGVSYTDFQSKVGGTCTKNLSEAEYNKLKVQEHRKAGLPQDVGVNIRLTRPVGIIGDLEVTDAGATPADGETGGGLMGFIMPIVVLGALGVGGYYIYKRVRK